MRALIVDEPGACEVIAKVLEKNGIESDVVHDYANAIAVFQRHPPDIIIAEVDLPGQTGYELIAWIRQYDERVSTIFYTNVVQRMAISLAVWVGVDGYLFKSEPADRLINMVKDIGIIKTRKQTKEIVPTEILSFYCICGGKVTAKAAASGKRMGCPSCQRMVEVPNVSKIIEGVWALIDSDNPRDPHNPGFMCTNCGEPVDIFTGDKSAELDCHSCGFSFHLPPWLESRRTMFRKYIDFENESTFEPIRDGKIRIQLRCSNCNTYYYADAESCQDHQCTFCGHIDDSKSLNKIPLAKARLKSTGRYVRIATSPNDPTMAGKSFLVPEQGAILIGSGPECQVRLREQGIFDKHCLIRVRDDLLEIKAFPKAKEIILGGKPLEGARKIGRPTEMYIRETLFRIYALSREMKEELKKRDVVVQQKTVNANAFFGQEALGNEAAKILQKHWQSL